MKTLFKLVAVALIAVPAFASAAIPMELSSPLFEKCGMCGAPHYKCCCVSHK
ncbi:MAG: hypothetical protein KF857_06265 [Fimbriimonadaceae bacterium]|nr:hypothetical protein [Fimbriimonadaceae bacterium]